MKDFAFFSLLAAVIIGACLTVFEVWALLGGYTSLTLEFNNYNEHLIESVLLSIIILCTIPSLVYLFNQWFPVKKK